MAKKHYLMGLVKANKDTGTFSFIASTGAIDRQGEVIDPAGWQLKRFMDNPVILWAHRYDELPVGKATSLSTDAKGLYVEGVFASADANPKAQQVRKLYEDGMLSAVSVGFIPLERNGNIITKSELLEISVVPVPANPEALSLMKTSMQLDASILKSLEDAMADEFHPEDEGAIEVSDEDVDLENEIALEDEIADTFEVDEEAKTWTLRKGDKVLATVKVADALLGKEVEVKEGRVLSSKNAQKIATVVGQMKDLSASLEELLSMAEAPKAGDENIVAKAEVLVITRQTLDGMREQLRLNDKHNELAIAVLNKVLNR